MATIDELINLQVNVANFGSLIGMTEGNVRKMIKSGILPICGKNPYRIKVKDGVQAYILNLERKAKPEARPVDDEKAKSEKLRADADISIYKAKQEELKWKELDGMLHRSEDVQAMTEDLIYTVRGAMTALPGKLAMNVATEDDPNVCSNLIQDEVNSILENLSEYEYSKARYLARMKERQGNEAKDSEEEDF